MGRPITIHRQPLYLLYLCLSYVLQYVSVSVFTVSHRIHTVQVYFANTNKHTEQTGRRKKKHTTEKELLEKHFHTMCDFPILSSMSGLFMYMCSMYTEAKIHETNRIFHLSCARFLIHCCRFVVFFFPISISLCLSSAYTHSHRYAVPLNGSMCLLIPFRQKRFKRKMKTSLRIGCECYSGVWCVFCFFLFSLVHLSLISCLFWLFCNVFN